MKMHRKWDDVSSRSVVLELQAYVKPHEMNVTHLCFGLACDGLDWEILSRVILNAAEKDDGDRGTFTLDST